MHNKVMATLCLYCKENDDKTKLVELFGNTDYNLIQVHTFDELLLTIPRNDIQIVIMDYVTPDGLNGFVNAQKLREDRRTRNLSIVLKVDENDNLQDEMSAQGVNDFLLTPFHDEEILSLVDRLASIEKRRPFQALIRLSLKSGTVMGKTLNISSTGLLVQVPREIPIGTNVEVNFFLPYSKQEIRCMGTIRRRAHERLTFNPCYGLEFDDLSEDLQEKLAHFVKKW